MWALFCMHFISNISFNSDHQVLDSGGWRPLSYTVPFLQKGNVARLFFPKYKPSVTLFPCSKPFWGQLPYPSIVLEARLPVFEPGSGICPYCVTGGMTLNLYASGSSLWSCFNNLPIRVAWGWNEVVQNNIISTVIPNSYLPYNTVQLCLQMNDFELLYIIYST